MASPHPLQDAFDRVDRALEHIGELDQREAALGRVYHDALVVEFNSKEPHNISSRLGQLIVVNSIFGILLGEIAYNLRAALDYLVYELARHDSGAIQQGTQFPICDFKSRFDGMRDRFLVGVNAAHRTAIEGLQPYSGCYWTAILRDISNPDKHCKLSDSAHGFAIHMNTMGYRTYAGAGMWASVCRSKRRAMHPTLGREMDVYLSTEVPVIVEISGRPKAVVKQVRELQTSVANTLKMFEPEF